MQDIGASLFQMVVQSIPGKNQDRGLVEMKDTYNLESGHASKELLDLIS